MSDNNKRKEIIDSDNEVNLSENHDERIADIAIEKTTEYDKEYIDEISEDKSIISEDVEEISSENKEENPESNIEQPQEPIKEKKSFINSIKEKMEESKIYIDYNIRLIGYCLIFITLFIIAVLFFKGAFNLSSSTTITYNENSSLDYKVYLKENDFYETDYLGKDKIYIASIIDNILIDFRYNFNIAKEADLNFTYDIIGKLTINDEASGNNFFEKEYVLLEDKVKSVKDATSYILSEQVKIDYDYYNALANKFKQQYGVEATSDLTVYLKINRETGIEGTPSALDSSTMFVKIPLTEKSIDIELNYQDINNSNYIVQTNNSMVDNVVFGILAVICVIAGIIIIIRIIKLLTLLNRNKSAYDKFVGRILTEYDRLIVENSTGPDTVKNNVIRISRFEELLDVRDNLKLPIMYYVIAKHNKCCFYIKHNRDLYLMTIKAVDLEKENNINKSL